MSESDRDFLDRNGYFTQWIEPDFDAFQRRMDEVESRPMPDGELAILNRVYNYYPDELPECMMKYLQPNIEQKSGQSQAQ